ncbi:hypothetical protein HMPREF9447_00755 [Bacteroides oleiciplenus YIT 12058]|uniref:Uncharacterized protein n=1 Tax=Bacteroides oleiciplenus YIT 12058 TaxID=742727 RepID=K9ET16_9BACE|nr:hypothetical protein HMPREF9447_00755 [Bacteroides oleiciplenus YIT 12058]
MLVLSEIMRNFVLHYLSIMPTESLVTFSRK